jgi:predicted nucleotidyltransferase
VYEETERVINRIKEIPGTVSIVLFGSLSRGDYDEGSDIDLIAVFKNKKDLDTGLREIYKTTAKCDLFFQVVGLTLEELEKSPLLETALREGKICYVTQDAEKLLTSTRKPYALVTYTTASLNAKERVVFTQELEGRHRGKYRYDGFIHKLRGYKVGRGVIMVPQANLKTLTEHLEEREIEYVVRYVWT